MRKALLVLVLPMLFLSGCSFFETEGNPSVVAPDPVIGARTIMVTQRAPDDQGYSDVYLTLRALKDDEEVKIVATHSPTSLAYLNDSRCAEVDNSNLAACALGSLQPGEAASPVAVHLAAGVVLQCAATPSFGGAPLPCRDASR